MPTLRFDAEQAVTAAVGRLTLGWQRGITIAGADERAHRRRRRCGRGCRRGRDLLVRRKLRTAVRGAAPVGAGAASPAPAASGPPVSVTTVRAQKRDVDVMLEATGTVTALNSVDVQPQIASMITKVHIKEGQFVKAGEPLFTLDARNDEVNVAKAQAQLAKDQAALADAERQLARSQDLFAQNFISQGAVDTNQTLVDAQRAVVAADRAAIEAAQVAPVVQRASSRRPPAAPARSTSSRAATCSRARRRW